MRQMSTTSRHFSTQPLSLLVQVDDLKEALQEMFKTSGVKGTPLLFLMTDGQIVNERFLIYINDILANGWISDLFPKVFFYLPLKLPRIVPDVVPPVVFGTESILLLQDVPPICVHVHFCWKPLTGPRMCPELAARCCG